MPQKEDIFIIALLGDWLEFQVLYSLHHLLWASKSSLHGETGKRWQDLQNLEVASPWTGKKELKIKPGS